MRTICAHAQTVKDVSTLHALAVLLLWWRAVPLRDAPVPYGIMVTFSAASVSSFCPRWCCARRNGARAHCGFKKKKRSNQINHFTPKSEVIFFLRGSGVARAPFRPRPGDTTFHVSASWTAVIVARSRWGLSWSVFADFSLCLLMYCEPHTTVCVCNVQMHVYTCRHIKARDVLRPRPLSLVTIEDGAATR